MGQMFDLSHKDFKAALKTFQFLIKENVLKTKEKTGNINREIENMRKNQMELLELFENYI